MIIELTTNVVIDGKTHSPGDVIDTAQCGISGESIITWGWGKAKKTKQPSTTDAPSDEPLTASTAVESTDESTVDAPAKPTSKRKPK